MQRDAHDVLASTVLRRGFAPLPKQAHTLRTARHEMDAMLGELREVSATLGAGVALVRYESLVAAARAAAAQSSSAGSSGGEDACWEALAEFWGIRQGILPRAAARVVVAQKRESDGANAWPQSEREFIADLFESAHANARLPFLGHARRNLQLPACIGL